MVLDPRQPANWQPESWEANVTRRLGVVEGDVDGLKDWRIEVRASFRMLQLTFGTSILAAVGALLGLYLLISKSVPS